MCNIIGQQNWIIEQTSAKGIQYCHANLQCTISNELTTAVQQIVPNVEKQHLACDSRNHQAVYQLKVPKNLHVGSKIDLKITAFSCFIQS